MDNTIRVDFRYPANSQDVPKFWKGNAFDFLRRTSDDFGLDFDKENTHRWLILEALLNARQTYRYNSSHREIYSVFAGRAQGEVDRLGPILDFVFDRPFLITQDAKRFTSYADNPYKPFMDTRTMVSSMLNVAYSGRDAQEILDDYAVPEKVPETLVDDFYRAGYEEIKFLKDGVNKKTLKIGRTILKTLGPELVKDDRKSVMSAEGFGPLALLYLGMNRDSTMETFGSLDHILTVPKARDALLSIVENEDFTNSDAVNAVKFHSAVNAGKTSSLYTMRTAEKFIKDFKERGEDFSTAIFRNNSYWKFNRNLVEKKWGELPQDNRGVYESLKEGLTYEVVNNFSYICQFVKNRIPRDLLSSAITETGDPSSGLTKINFRDSFWSYFYCYMNNKSEEDIRTAFAFILENGEHLDSQKSLWVYLSNFGTLKDLPAPWIIETVKK